MKIFISSLINGYEDFRAAARAAVTSLGHEPVMAEDFTAQANSSQIACLRGIRESDLVVLVLMERYGSVMDASGESPTHEEYAEARDTKQIIAFVREGLDREPLQAKLIAEAQAWSTGLFRGGFASPEELRSKITNAIHKHDLATQAAPIDEEALAQTAVGMIPNASRGGSSGVSMLNVSIAPGPSQVVVRQADLEAPSLARDMTKQALFGDSALFDVGAGTKTAMEDDALTLRQDREARIELDEKGSLLMRVTIDAPAKASDYMRSGLGGLIEETVVSRILAALAYADWVLDRIDPTERLTHVAICASIDSGPFTSWRTQAEHDASANSSSVSMGGAQDLPPVRAFRHRAALGSDSARLAEDLMVPLRRQRKAR